MSHREHHPKPVEGCFGCKVQGIGYQGRQSRAGGRRSDPTQNHPVTAEEGTRAGKTVGHHVEHWDGRQDAVVRPATLVMKATTEEKE